MASRRGYRQVSDRSSPLQLFPFLSVIACTLGSMMFLIIIISMKIATDAQQRLLTLPETSEETDTSNKELIYVECREEGIVVYPGNQFISEDEIDAPNSVFQELLNRLQLEEEAMIYLLVRPSGVEAFDQTRTLIEQEEIDFRYEPIDENWQLDI